MLFLPLSVAVIFGSFACSWIVGKTGARLAAASGLLVLALSSLVTAGISAVGGIGYVLAGSSLAGLGLGCAAVAATGIGTSAAGSEEQGLASGLLNSAAQVGTALGVAVLVTVAAARTGTLLDGGAAMAEAAVEGYRWAFFASAGLAVAGSLVAIFVVREKKAL